MIKHRSNIVLNIDKKSFYKQFSDQISEGDIHLHLPVDSNILGSKSKFKGEVKFDKFKIRRKSSLSNSTWILPHIEGNIEEINNSKISIDLFVNGFYYKYKIGLLIFTVGIFMFCSVYITQTSKMQNLIAGIGIFIFIIALAQQFIRTRDLVRLDLFDIERELNYVAAIINSK